MAEVGVVEAVEVAELGAVEVVGVVGIVGVEEEVGEVVDIAGVEEEVGAVEVGVEVITGVAVAGAVEAGVGVIAVATLTLPGITRTIPVTTVVTVTDTTTILHVLLHTITDPIHTTMVTQHIHPPSITLTVSANPSSLASQVTGGGSYSYGSTASFSVNQAIVQIAPNTQYVFQGWTGGYTGTATSGSITMTSSSTVTAVYQPQYLLTLSAQPSGSPSPQGSGWFNAGSTASISVPSQTVSQNAGSQLVFSGWTVDGSSSQGGSTLSLQMNAPHVVVAQYTQQYYLTVQSPQGVTSGQGWYNAGSNCADLRLHTFLTNVWC